MRERIQVTVWEELVQSEKSQYPADTEKNNSSNSILHRILVLRSLPRQDLTSSHTVFPGIYDLIAHVIVL